MILSEKKDDPPQKKDDPPQKKDDPLGMEILLERYDDHLGMERVILSKMER
jgi:hypothetical protein